MIDARKLGFIDCIGLGGYHAHHRPKPYTTLFLRRKGYRCVVCYKFWSIGYLRAMGVLHD